MTTKPYLFVPNTGDTDVNRIAALETAVQMITSGYFLQTSANQVSDGAFQGKGPNDAQTGNPNTVVKFN